MDIDIIFDIDGTLMDIDIKDDIHHPIPILLILGLQSHLD